MATSASSKSSATEKAAAAAHEGVDKVAERAAEAEARIREAAEAAEAKIRESAELASQQGAASMDRVKGFVDEHPIAALGLAFGAGIIVSSLLRK